MFRFILSGCCCFFLFSVYFPWWIASVWPCIYCSFEFVYSFFSLAIIFENSWQKKDKVVMVVVGFFSSFVVYVNMGLIIITAKHFKLLKWGASANKMTECTSYHFYRHPKKVMAPLQKILYVFSSICSNFPYLFILFTHSLAHSSVQLRSVTNNNSWTGIVGPILKMEMRIEVKTFCNISHSSSF